MKWTWKPPYGTTRVVYRFALFPIRCNSGSAAWLEFVYICQIYTSRFTKWENMYFGTREDWTINNLQSTE